MGRVIKKSVALIPARGGSKRLPRKNILDFYGKPIIAYSIQAALETDLFDQVVVSTEDDEIADIADQYGAVIDQRSNNLATDSARVLDVCIDYLSRLQLAGSTQSSVSTLTVLYATAPLRNAKDIYSVVSLLSDECHFAMAATLCDWPVHQTLMINDSCVSPVFPDLVNKRSDELESFCVDNGSTYAVHVDEFLQQKTFYGNGLKAYLMPSVRSIDIDTPEDYDRALYEAEKMFV